MSSAVLLYEWWHWPSKHGTEIIDGRKTLKGTTYSAFRYDVTEFASDPRVLVRYWSRDNKTPTWTWFDSKDAATEYLSHRL